MSDRGPDQRSPWAPTEGITGALEPGAVLRSSSDARGPDSPAAAPKSDSGDWATSLRARKSTADLGRQPEAASSSGSDESSSPPDSSTARKSTADLGHKPEADPRPGSDASSSTPDPSSSTPASSSAKPGDSGANPAASGETPDGTSSGTGTSNPGPGTPTSGWPWEENTGSHEARVAAGPAVKTERLYRSAKFPDPNAAADPLAERQNSNTNVITPAIEDVAASPGVTPPIDTAEAAAPTRPYVPSQLPEADSGRGLGTFVVFLIIAGLTSVVGFLDMQLNRQFTWITGAVFVGACIIGAVSVRRRDLWTAVIAPPLAYLVALLIAGQPSTLGSTGSLIIREVSLVATGLAFNAPFIFGGTIAALIIVLIRRTGFRNRDRSAGTA